MAQTVFVQQQYPSWLQDDMLGKLGTVFWFLFEFKRQNLPRTIDKCVLANQVRPQQASIVFKKGVNMRVNSHSGETFPFMKKAIIGNQSLINDFFCESYYFLLFWCLDKTISLAHG